ncbi:hypothetical protein GEMRC1_012889 [Eukaryota sp. GEM-RC1]
MMVSGAVLNPNSRVICTDCVIDVVSFEPVVFTNVEIASGKLTSSNDFIVGSLFLTGGNVADNSLITVNTMFEFSSGLMDNSVVSTHDLLINTEFEKKLSSSQLLLSNTGQWVAGNLTLQDCSKFVIFESAILSSSSSGEILTAALCDIMEIYGKFECISGCYSTLNHLVVLPSGDLTVTEGTVDLSGPTLIEGVINIDNDGILELNNEDVDVFSTGNCIVSSGRIFFNADVSLNCTVLHSSVSDVNVLKNLNMMVSGAVLNPNSRVICTDCVIDVASFEPVVFTNVEIASGKLTSSNEFIVENLFLIGGEVDSATISAAYTLWTGSSVTSSTIKSVDIDLPLATGFRQLTDSLMSISSQISWTDGDVSLFNSQLILESTGQFEVSGCNTISSDDSSHVIIYGELVHTATCQSTVTNLVVDHDALVSIPSGDLRVTGNSTIYGTMSVPSVVTLSGRTTLSSMSTISGDGLLVFNNGTILSLIQPDFPRFEAYSATVEFLVPVSISNFHATESSIVFTDVSSTSDLSCTDSVLKVEHTTITASTPVFDSCSIHVINGSYLLVTDHILDKDLSVFGHGTFELSDITFTLSTGSLAVSNYTNLIIRSDSVFKTTCTSCNVRSHHYATITNNGLIDLTASDDVFVDPFVINNNEISLCATRFELSKFGMNNFGIIETCTEFQNVLIFRAGVVSSHVPFDFSGHVLNDGARTTLHEVIGAPITIESGSVLLGSNFNTSYHFFLDISCEDFGVDKDTLSVDSFWKDYCDGYGLYLSHGSAVNEIHIVKGAVKSMGDAFASAIYTETPGAVIHVTNSSILDLLPGPFNHVDGSISGEGIVKIEYGWCNWEGCHCDYGWSGHDCAYTCGNHSTCETCLSFAYCGWSSDHQDCDVAYYDTGLPMLDSYSNWYHGTCETCSLTAVSDIATSSITSAIQWRSNGFHFMAVLPYVRQEMTWYLDFQKFSVGADSIRSVSSCSNKDPEVMASIDRTGFSNSAPHALLTSALNTPLYLPYAHTHIWRQYPLSCSTIALETTINPLDLLECRSFNDDRQLSLVPYHGTFIVDVQGSFFAHLIAPSITGSGYDSVVRVAENSLWFQFKLVVAKFRMLTGCTGPHDCSSSQSFPIRGVSSSWDVEDAKAGLSVRFVSSADLLEVVDSPHNSSMIIERASRTSFELFSDTKLDSAYYYLGSYFISTSQRDIFFEIELTLTRLGKSDAAIADKSAYYPGPYFKDDPVFIRTFVEVTKNLVILTSLSSEPVSLRSSIKGAYLCVSPSEEPIAYNEVEGKYGCLLADGTPNERAFSIIHDFRNTPSFNVEELETTNELSYLEVASMTASDDESFVLVNGLSFQAPYVNNPTMYYLHVETVVTNSADDSDISVHSIASVIFEPTIVSSNTRSFLALLTVLLVALSSVLIVTFIALQFIKLRQKLKLMKDMDSVVKSKSSKLDELNDNSSPTVSFPLNSDSLGLFPNLSTWYASNKHSVKSSRSGSVSSLPSLPSLSRNRPSSLTSFSKTTGQSKLANNSNPGFVEVPSVPVKKLPPLHSNLPSTRQSVTIGKGKASALPLSPLPSTVTDRKTLPPLKNSQARIKRASRLVGAQKSSFATPPADFSNELPGVADILNSLE